MRYTERNAIKTRGPHFKYNHMNKLRINRRNVNNLKLKGKKWLMDNIEYEKKAIEKMGEIDSEPYKLYVLTMERALEELQNEEGEDL